MRVVPETSAAPFADYAMPWLLRDPVGNNVAAQLISERASGHMPTEAGSYWLSVRDERDEVVAVAGRTPPNGLLLSDASGDAAAALARWCAAHDPGLPWANGPVPVADAFAAAWSAAGGTAEPTADTRIFRLDRVEPPRAVPGHARVAEPGDAPLLYTWVRAFFAEAAPHEDAAGVPPTVDRKIAAGALWIWEDDGPASMLWTGPPSGGVVRISAVYTPAERRGRGYASASVAAVSARVLADGAVACSLYTDLANPTSNKIYQAIGYRAVRDIRVWTLTPPPASPPPPPSS